MSKDTADAAPACARATEVDDVNLGSIRGTRVVLWVVSDSGFDASRLAKHLAAAQGGAASVTIMSVDEIPAMATPHAMPIGNASASALAGPRWQPCDAAAANVLPFIEPLTPPRRLNENRHGAHAERKEFRFRRRRDPAHPMAERAIQPHDRGRLRRIDDAVGGRSGDLPACSAEAAAASACAMQMPPCNSCADGVANFNGDAPPSARDVAEPLTVMVASGRQGLLDALMPRWAREPDITVLGDPVADPAHLLKSLRKRQPRLLLLDQRLFDRLGPELARTIAATAPRVRVLLLCEVVNVGLVEAVLRNRFHGVLLTSSSPDASLKAIRAVSCGEFWLPRTLLAHAVFDPLQAPAPGDETAQADRPLDAVKDALTPREAQVVEHLRQGFTNKEIARRLGVMEDTVKKHLQSIFAKLGVHRRALVVLRPSGGPSSLA